MTSSQIQWIILVFGGLFLVVGLAIRFGLWKSWYWRNVRMVHGYIPLGLLLILYAFTEMARDKLGSSFVFFQAATILIFLVGIWWSLRPPHFMIPEWVRWVEAHPKKVVAAMIKAVRDGQDWKPKVASKEAVNAWARAIKAKLPKK